MEVIPSIGDLIFLAKNKTIVCIIKLNVGMYGDLNVEKKIRYNLGAEKPWSVFNKEKNCFESMRLRGLKENTCITEAINKGGLFLK